tara:strand:- start:786 stop:1106 length:321 start_codon:yes stop_codon:yes gene_type:complete
MKTSELEIGEFYKIKNNTRKKITMRMSEYWGLSMVLVESVSDTNKAYSKSYYQYLGKRTVKVEKRLDSKRKEVYTYKPHMMLCLQTGEICKVAGYYLRNFFVKPEK